MSSNDATPAPGVTGAALAPRSTQASADVFGMREDDAPACETAADSAQPTPDESGEVGADEAEQAADLDWATYFPGAPLELRALLGPPAISAWEDGRNYRNAFNALADTIAPTDALEWMAIKDATDATFDLQRLAEAKTEALNQALGNILNENLPHVDHSLSGVKRREALIAGYLQGTRRSIEEVETKLLSKNIDAVSVERRAFLASLDMLKTFDVMIGLASYRRRTAFAAIDRRRTAKLKRDVLDLAIKRATAQLPSQDVE